MPPYDRRVTRTLPLLAAMLLLSACAPDVTLAPLDVPQADAAEDARALEVGADAAPDAPTAPDAPADVASPDASPPDVPPVDATAPDAPADVGSIDAPEDAAPDAGPDVADVPADRELPRDAARDVVADVPADVASDRADAAPIVDAGPPSGPCTFTGDIRCYEGDRWSCIGGVWMPNPCGIAPRGGASLCTMNSCYVCRAAASGAGCAAEPLCTTDADCLGMGLARCIAGLCSRRSLVVCTTDADCVRAWGAVPSGMQCNERPASGGTAFFCENPFGTGGGTGAGSCTSEATCPRGYSCYASDHICHPL